ncbi:MULTISPECIES: sensor histidine kinase [unclassified Duganella]|uniref:sensor histidine kinase n=1 Tax=unclassified Duganella TaxID=2636909 RepID=UPI000E349DC8|nr:MULTISPECIES: histidine kinase [unclassified Duganella]RFP18884.1 sensor histidine kinase [Duganella sp. BJB475]RFP35547.1 sensor histidine kinase [Duganella sp. BJB476]
MLPKRTQITIAAAWILFWLLMNVTAVQEYLRDHEHGVWKPILWESSSALTGTLLLLAQRHFTRRYDHLLAQPLRWFARQLVWLPIYWVLFVPIAFGIRAGVYALAGETYEHMPWPQTFMYEDVKMTVFFSIFATIMFGVLSYHAMQNEKLRVERVNASLREAQLLRLTQQMQPHFLFNALNTISSLMHSDVARADAMLIQLADVLRATLDVSEQHQVTLEMELRLLRGYAALMSERFSDRVHIDWRIDDALLGCQVPVMSMQPLLENIFKHTVERRRQATGITISASRDQDVMLLRLEDDGGMLPAANAARDARPNGGIGVRNLRERLAALYGAGASFDLIQLSPAGVRAEMRLPCVS